MYVEFWMMTMGFSKATDSNRYLQMYLRLIGIFTAVLLVGCDKKDEVLRAVPVSEDGAMVVNAMTFNIRHEDDGDTGQRAWSERVGRIVRMVREEEVDIMGIQEGQHGQVADLRVSLPDYDFAGRGRSDGEKKGEYAGIFFRKDRFENDEERSGMIWLSDTPEVAGSKTWGNGYPRVATWVKLVDRSSGQGLWVVNMHLDHRNQPSREKGVRLMAERLVAMNVEAEPVIWMGDFNATESNSVVRFLKGQGSSLKAVEGFSGFRETYDALNAGVKKRGTLHFWMNDRNRQWKVDHVFVSKEGQVLESGILRSGEPYLSDHFPVWARVRFE